MGSNKKRILIITNRFYPQIGGAEINIFHQSQELSKHYYVDVFTPARSNGKACEPLGNIKIFRLYNLYNPLNKFPYLKSEAFCPSIFFRILFGKYDIIHCFPGYNYNNILGLILGKIRKIPVFLTNFDICDFKTLLRNNFSFDNFSLSGKQKYILSKFDAIFAISNKETELIRTANPKTFLSIVPVRIGLFDREVDLHNFKKRYAITSDCGIILCLGRISYIKGQDILLRAVPLLKKELERFLVLFVGRTEYEPAYFSTLGNFIKKNNLEENVRFLGCIPDDDMAAALKICDLHVVPVRFMNSGAVIVETWAAKKAVLQSNMVDPNYIAEGENGYTFDINNTNELVNKIVHLMTNPALRSSMGKAGRRLVEKKFLYPVLLRQYMAQYKI